MSQAAAREIPNPERSPMKLRRQAWLGLGRRVWKAHPGFSNPLVASWLFASLLHPSR
jgi:hypothetical protein